MKKNIRNTMLCALLVCLLALTPQMARAAVTTFTSGATTCSLDSKTRIMTISGTGAMADYTSASATPWYSYRYNIDGIVAEEGVTRIGNYAFASMPYVTSVTLPTTLKAIGNYAFSDPWETMYVSISSPLETIGTSAFDSTAVVSASGTAGDLTWKLSYGTLTISGSGEMPDYTIATNPAPWNALVYSDLVSKIDIQTGVTRIGDHAFALYKDTGTLTVNLPEGLVSIGDSAFEYGNISSITFPSSLREIGEDAFSETSMSSVYLNDGLETLGDGAFSGAWNVTTVRIPASLKNWGSGAFYNNDALTSVTLAAGLTSIGKNAFRDCAKLKEISFPDSIVEIGAYAFQECQLVYTLPPYVERIGDYAFYVSGYHASMSSVTLPATVKSTGANSFPRYTYANGTYEDFVVNYSGGTSGSLTWKVNGGVLSITGSGAMEDYSLDFGAPWSCLKNQITSVSLDSRVTSIGEAAFRGLSLGSFTIPSGVKSIGAYAFSNTAVDSVVIPSGVTEIKGYTFYGSSVKDVTIPEGVTTIGDYAFYSCSNLAELAVPASVTEIGSNFVNLSVTTVTSGLWLKGVLTNTIDWKMVGNTLILTGSGAMPSFEHETSSKYNIDMVDTPWWNYRTRIAKVVIGEGITTISNAAFYKCINLTSASLPSTLTSIATEAFESTALASIDLPDSVTSIANWAFNGTKLTSFTFPKGVTQITGLTNCSKLETVIIPEDSQATSVNGNAFAGCSSLKSISLPDGITDISSYTFNNCTSLTNVQLPKNLVSIGERAFYGCSALEGIELPQALTSIGKNAFYGCTALTAIDIPDGVTTLGGYCFDGCTGLASVSLPASLTAIPEYAFRNCTALTRIEIPAQVTSVGTYAFFQCTGLNEVVLPEGLTSVGAYAFYNCSAISALNLPAALATVDGCAFYGCSAVPSLTIPASVTAINGNGFGGMTSLQRITFEGEAPTTMASNIFSNATATVTYVPYDSWSGKIQNYGGTLTWVKVNGTCGEGATWQLETDAILRVNGSGVVSSAGWTDYAANVTTLVVGDAVSGIELALADTLPNLQQIVFAGNCPAIASGTFANLAVQAYYPHGYPLWTEELRQSYGGETAWSVYCARSGESVTLPSVTAQPEIPAACLTDGTAAHWACGCGQLFADESLLTVTSAEALVLPALGHSYGEPAFAWAEDGSACTVSFTCAACGDVQSPEVTLTNEQTTPPDCVNPGQTTYTASVTFGEETAADPENPDATIVQPKVYTDQLILSDVAALGHTEVTIPGIEPTCMEPGMMDYIFCETCGEELQLADEIPALGHTEMVTSEALEPTCTEEGHTQEISCSVCLEILVAAEPISALGHEAMVSAEAVAPDCVNTGLTEEISCAVCGEVLEPAKTVDALGHTAETDEAVAPDCVNTGLTEGSHCSVCGEVLTAQETVAALGHTPETDAAVAPTDRETGLTEGSHCAVCGEVLIAQETVPANFDWDGDTVTAYNGEATDVVIPDGTLALGGTLFKGNTTITSVRVPESVTAIGTQTFFGCTGLADIWLPENLTSISAQTFYNVTAKIHVSAESATAVALSYRSVPFTTEDGYTLRYRVTSATGTPSAVWLIAYQGTEQSVTLPETVNGAPLTQIQTKAFAACGELEEILIPASVTSIAADAFEGCADTLVIRSAADAYARTWADAQGYAWAHDQHTQDILAAVEATCTKTGLTEGVYCAGCGEVLVAQEVVEPLGHTLSAVQKVYETTVGESVQVEFTFLCCQGEGAEVEWLSENPAAAEFVSASVDAQSGVATAVFTGKAAGAAAVSAAGAACTIVVHSDVQMALPANLTKLETEAFMNAAVQEVILPEGAESIGERVFANCSELVIVHMPDSVKTIANDAFDGSEQVMFICESENAAAAYAAEKEIPCVILQ